MEKWQQTSAAVQKDFIESPGVIEVTTDGTIVNTTGGPREVKLALIAKRALGKGVLPEQWAERPLPRHNACVAFAAVEEKEQFQKRFAFWRYTVNGNKLPFFYHEEHKGCTKDTKPCACVSLCSL